MIIISCEKTTGVTSLIKELGSIVRVKDSWLCPDIRLKLIDFDDIKSTIYTRMLDLLFLREINPPSDTKLFFDYPELLGRVLNEYTSDPHIVIVGHIPVNSFTALYCIRSCREDVMENSSDAKLDADELIGDMTRLQVEVHAMSYAHDKTSSVKTLERDEFLTKELLIELIEDNYAFGESE